MAYGKSITFDGSIVPENKEDGFQLNFSPGGTAWMRFSVGVYQGKDDDGEYKDSLWMRCVVFGDRAENLAESVKSGDPVIVVGELQANNWENKDGEKQYGTSVMVDLIGMDMSRYPATSGKMWSDQPDEKGKKKAKKKAKARKDYGPDEAPF